MDTELSAEESAKALKDAEAKGLPKGWSVKLDKRRRRKWIAPNGKSCDSIPKAIAISIDIGLLPPDTPIPFSNKKRAASKDPPSGGKTASKKSKTTTTKLQPSSKLPSLKKPGRPKKSSSSSKPGRPKLSSSSSSSSVCNKLSPKLTNATKDDDNKKNKEENYIDDDHSTTKRTEYKDNYEVEDEKEYDDDEEDDDDDYDDVVSDPEESLEPFSANKTVHWDPEGPMGRMVGWKIRIWDTKIWRDGRIILYDPYTNKHKVKMFVNTISGLDKTQCIWLRLIHEVDSSIRNTFSLGTCQRICLVACHGNGW